MFASTQIQEGDKERGRHRIQNRGKEREREGELKYRLKTTVINAASQVWVASQSLKTWLSFPFLFFS